MVHQSLLPVRIVLTRAVKSLVARLCDWGQRTVGNNCALLGIAWGGATCGRLTGLRRNRRRDHREGLICRCTGDTLFLIRAINRTVRAGKLTGRIDTVNALSVRHSSPVGAGRDTSQCEVHHAQAKESPPLHGARTRVLAGGSEKAPRGRLQIGRLVRLPSSNGSYAMVQNAKAGQLTWHAQASST